MKKVFLFAAMAAAVLSSCSKNEISEIATPNENPNAIGLNVGTFATKSAVTTTGTLETYAGVTLYSANTTFGNLPFSYASNIWTNTASKTWAGVTFPVEVYSMHDGANVELTDQQLASFSVATDVADQKDLVYFAQTINAIPTSGMISATYKHALSRVKMSEKTNEDVVTSISQVSLVGFDGTAVPAMDADDNTISWTGNSDAQTASYVYDLENASTATNDMYIIPQTSIDFAEDTDGNADLSSTISGVSLLCYTTVAEEPRAGFVSVAVFKEKNPLVESVKIEGASEEYTGAMYIRAILPIDAKDFTDAIYYNLELNLAGANIYYNHDGDGDGEVDYYTKDGEKLVITGTESENKPKPEDPINPDATDLISLSIIVLEWPEATTVAL